MDSDEVAKKVVDRLLQDKALTESVNATGMLWVTLAVAPPMLLAMFSDWGWDVVFGTWWAIPAWGLLVFGVLPFVAVLRLWR